MGFQETLTNATGPKLNDFVELAFYPIAFNVKRFANGTSICPTKGEVVDGRVVDTDCDTDKFETCMTNVYGCHGGGCSPQVQSNLVNFLSCFEGEHHANFSFAPKCAAAHGLSFSAIEKCYNDVTRRETLWKKELAMPQRDSLKSFPTVLINGEPFIQYGKKSLASYICEAYVKEGWRPPASCGY